ncbi:MAG: sigma-70 family RNA polymerase sigma factor [Clostridia bacterium]|nr:sigma-70 family RNA polymerase sigma factor [Clostridia bacterium]
MTEEVQKLSKAKFNKLLKEMAKGNQAAFDTFYSAYGRYVYSIAVSVTKSYSLADEIVDDVLFKIWQNASKLKNIENPPGWIYIVTSNCAKDKLKAEKAFSEIYDIPQDDKNIEEFIIKNTFLSDISSLDEEEQFIFISKFIKDLTLESIAKAIDKPLSTVSSIYYRALKKLKQTVKMF